MTPEQMREAAARIADDIGDVFHVSFMDNYKHIATRIRAIPLTPPEPTMLERLTWMPVPPGQSRREHAAKILETMREPTEAMIQAVFRDCPCSSDFIRMWQAAIDAALAEK